MIYNMRNVFIFLLFIFFSAIVFSCQDNLKQKELEIKEKELVVKEKELANIEKKQKETAAVNDSAVPVATYYEEPAANYSANTSKTKYGFVIFKCNLGELQELSENMYWVKTTTSRFASKVIEIPNFSIDEEYKLLDEGEREMNSKLNLFKQQLHGEIVLKVRPYEKGDELLKSAENKYQVLDREAKVYDTYSEASIARKNMGF